jgi:Uma2 family endonuclease
MALAVKPKSPATYQDVLNAPPHVVAEVIRGVLHTQPRPAPRHALAHSHLCGELVGPFGKGRGGPGGWLILVEPELHLDADILVPDLAGWRRERMPTLPEEAWFSLAPDWACEILSPKTRRADVTDKRDIYAEQGVGHLWFLDPDARTLEAFALRRGRWSLLAALRDDAEVRQPPFDAITFSLSVLWPD